MAILKLKNLWSRVTSGVLLGVLLLSLVVFHKGFTLILILLFATVGFLEIMFINKNQKSLTYTAIALVLFMWALSSGVWNMLLSPTLPPNLSDTFKVIEWPKIIILCLVLSSTPLLTKKITFKTTLTHVVALTIFIGAARSTMWVLFKSANFKLGFELLILILLTVIAADVGGYFVGSMYGKNKIQADISPKKTWEGFFGGVALAYVWVTVWCFLFFVPFINNDITKTIIFIYSTTWLFCVSSLIGDLCFSLLKRIYQIDDFSQTIPGHGGVLDRVDSIIFTMTIFYLILSYLT